MVLFTLLFFGCRQEKIIPIVPHTASVMLPLPTTVTVEEEKIPSSPKKEIQEYIPQMKYRQMKTIQGGSITIGEHARGFSFPKYKGKVVLLEFFGKDCHYCFEEMPVINRIQNQYKEQLSIIAIQSSEAMSQEERQRLTEEHPMNYPIVDRPEAMSLLVYLRDVYQWRGILPYLMLIKEGQIEQVFKGTEGSYKNISEGIEEIL